MLLAKNVHEYEILQKQVKSGSRVAFTGDAALKTYPGDYPKIKEHRVLIATAGDLSRATASSEVIREMITHLTLAIDKYGVKVSKVILKQHPGHLGAELNIGERGIVELCAKRNIPFENAPRLYLFEDLAKDIDIALIQSSLSTHLGLRGAGKESYIYLSDKENNSTVELCKKSKMPLCKYHHKFIGKYDATAYNRWYVDTFKVKGAAVETAAQLLI